MLPAETRGSGNDNVAAELDIGVGAGFTDVCWFDVVADVVVAGVVGTDVGVNDDADRSVAAAVVFLFRDAVTFVLF